MKKQSLLLASAFILAASASAQSNAENSVKLHVFVDRSTLEVFVNDGVEVCTTTFFMQ
jgi:sucrose-6-phosphate hydrolase SacC (GH32 family)